jgi:hypothetical protein
MRFYIVQETSTGFRPLPYTEKGFSNRSAAYRYLKKSGEPWCKVSNREASFHSL